MKRAIHWMVVVGLVMGAGRAVLADDVTGKIGVRGLAAAAFSAGDTSVNNNTESTGQAFGGSVLYGLCSHSSLGVGYENINLYGENGQRHHPQSLLASVYYHFSPERKLVPTLQLGGGASNVTQNGSFNNPTGRAGFELDYFFTPNFSAGPQIGYTYIADGADSPDEYHIMNAGLVATLYFGAPKAEKTAAVTSAPPPPAATPAAAAPVAVAAVSPADSDRDGVMDSMDRCPGTPSGVPVDPNGCPKRLEQKVSIVIKVLFDTGKSEVKPEYRAEVQQAANFLAAYPDVNGEIEGHTDNVGHAPANQRLSQRRADAVRAYLIKEFGINPSRLKAVGYGQDRPIADNATVDGREKNRRVAMTLEAMKQ